MVAESDYLALGDVSSKLILASVAEAAELNARDLSTDGRSEMLDLGGRGDEVGKGRVGILAVIIVLERLQGRVSLAGVPGREVVGILCVM